MSMADSLTFTMLQISWIWKSREEIEEKCEEDIDPMRDMAAAELKDLRKRSRELRIALEKVMGEAISTSLANGTGTEMILLFVL